MITVADILALPSFENVEPASASDEAGAREVRNVGIVDCPPDYNDDAVYMPGELILTNLGFAYNDPVLAERSLLALVARNVSAIAVKRVYNAPVSERVKEEARRADVPIYLYDGAYHERVAHESLELIDRDKSDAERASIIADLLRGHNSDSIRTALYRISGATGASVQCFAIAPRTSDALSLYATRDAVTAAFRPLTTEFSEVAGISACRYADNILLFVSHLETQGSMADAIGARCEELLMLENDLVCGVGSLEILQDGDLSIRQAMAALEEARRSGRRLARWDEMGIDAFAFAACHDRMFMSAGARVKRCLAAYDAAHSSELVYTAKCLNETDGDVKKTAELLFQHPNTVRYRMRKMKKLLAMEDQSDRVFLNVLMLVFLAD